jgi:hypothetical protein
MNIIQHKTDLGHNHEVDFVVYELTVMRLVRRMYKM